ncbi:hypothetical protein Landi51_05367 [Colletotrichum acutatum]
MEGTASACQGRPCQEDRLSRIITRLFSSNDSVAKRDWNAGEADRYLTLIDDWKLANPRYLPFLITPSVSELQLLVAVRLLPRPVGSPPAEGCQPARKMDDRSRHTVAARVARTRQKFAHVDRFGAIKAVYHSVKYCGKTARPLGH